MAERTEERTGSADGDRESVDGALADLEGDAGVETGGPDAAPGLDPDVERGLGAADAGTSGGAGETSRVRSLAPGRSLAAFAGSALATLLGALALSAVLPFGPLGGLVAVLLAAAGLGVASGESRYAASALGGGAAGVLATFFSFVVVSVVTGGLPLLVGGVVGAVAGLVGHYAGRDLRDGLTREL